MAAMHDIRAINQAFRRELQFLCETDPPTPCEVSTTVLSDTSLKLAVKYTGDTGHFDPTQWNRLTACLDRLMSDHGVESDILLEKNAPTPDGKPSLERVFHLEG
jgi:hypothetical protein